MDPITHGLAGAVIARTGFSGSLGKWGPVTGVVVALLPDSDSILRIFGEELFLRYHRGITHSLILLPVFSLLLAILFRRLSKTGHLFHFYLLCFLALLSHILLDLMTSFGTMALSPFTDQRLSWDIVFIIDPYFTGILLIPFIFTPLIKRYKRELSALSLSLLVPYTGLCISNHNYAISVAYEEVEAKGLIPDSVSALPQPLSPFKWVTFIDTGERLYQRFINRITGLNNGHNPETRVWDKRPNSPFVEKALRLPGVEFYMWFARFPVAVERDITNGRRVVEFIDLRFDIMRERIPFSYIVEFNREGAVILEKFSAT